MKTTISPWTVLCLSVVLCVSASACHTTLIVNGPMERSPLMGSAPVQPKQKQRQGNVALGIHSLKSTQADNCADRSPPDVRIRTDFLDNLIHVAIGPVYTSLSVETYCRPEP